MAESTATITEAPESREYTVDKSYRMKYIVRGAADDAEVKSLVDSTAPANIHDLERDPAFNIKEIRAGVSDPSTSIYYVDVDYVAPQNQRLEIGDIEVTYDLSPGTNHITQALARTASAVKSPYVKADLDALVGNTIGVNSDGTVEGVDVQQSIFTFTVRKIYSTAGCPTPATIVAMKDKTNNATFSVADSFDGQTITIPAGECLFAGASKARYGVGMIAMTYKFITSPNQDSIEINGMSAVAKGGHQYLSVLYRKFTSGTEQITAPAYVGVFTLYGSGNFGNFNI